MPQPARINNNIVRVERLTSLMNYKVANELELFGNVSRENKAMSYETFR